MTDRSSRRSLEHVFETAVTAISRRHAALLREAERAANLAWLAQGDALLDLWSELVPTFGPRRVPGEAHLLAEAAAALGLHEQALQHRLAEAVELLVHPQVRARLVEGAWSVAHARVALTELAALHDPRAPTPTPTASRASTTSPTASPSRCWAGAAPTASRSG